MSVEEHLNKELPYKAFVFEGSGTAGFCYQGCIEVFEKHGLLDEVEYFAGSSSGSFVAGALACGASPKLLREILVETDFSNFLDHSFGVCRDLYRLFSKYGYYKGDYIEQWFGRALSKIIGNSEITFKEAHEKTGKTLVITTTDLTTGEILYMSHKTTPHLKIKRAVRRSTALPIIYKPDINKEITEITVNDKTRKENLEHYYVDGGLLNNYPIYHFDDLVEDPKQVVGFKQMTSLELSELTNPYTDTSNPKPPQSLQDFMMRFFILIINKNFKIHIPQKDWERTVRIDTREYSSVDFNLNEKDKEFLLKQGRDSAEKFLANSQ